MYLSHLNSCLPTLLVAWALLARITEGGFQDGDVCGVIGSDFMNDDFSGDFLVAGAKGCTFGDLQEGCYCAPDFVDKVSMSEWKWQCGETVKFGPAEGKVCPDTVPLAKGLPGIFVVPRRSLDSAEVGAAGNGDDVWQPIECDLSIHPSGRPGDEVCPYSDCDEGGNNSAICGCVELSKYGMGVGQRWFCMHSTCSCVDEEEGEQEVSSDIAGPGTSLALPLTSSVALPLMLGSVFTLSFALFN